MTIMPLGYLFFGSIAFGVMLMVGVSRRRKKNGKATGLVVNLYFGTILVIISSLFIMGTAFGAHTIFQMVSFPKYEATIISYDSAWETVERTDSDGDTYSEQVLMHTPELRFTDDAGQIITKDGNIRSGSEPIIGDTVRVAYKDGNLLVISAASFFMMFALTFMLMILGYIVTVVSCFALGLKPKWVDVAGTVVFASVIYGGMFGMFGAMIYGVYKYFQPGSDMPLWAMLMCAFFSITLILALIGIFTGLKDDALD